MEASAFSCGCPQRAPVQDSEDYQLASFERHAGRCMYKYSVGLGGIYIASIRLSIRNYATNITLAKFFVLSLIEASLNMCTE